MAKLTSPHIPVAFRLPEEVEEFRRFTATHPNVTWVSKSNLHRGIQVRPNQVDILGSAPPYSASSEQQFVQEFVDSPLLIDGRKFDIGVYVVVTSVRMPSNFEGGIKVHFTAR